MSLAAGFLAGAGWHGLAPAARAVNIGLSLPGSSRQYGWRNGTPFSLGVASGAPRPDGFTLWTRLAPDPLLAEAGQGSGSDLGLAGLSSNADDIEIGQEMLGPWGGTRERARESMRMTVPERTRLMLVEIGLRGATGRADFDDVQVVPAAQNPTALPRRIGH